METAEKINTIGVLSGALDSLTRAKKDEQAKEVSNKILELIKQINFEDSSLIVSKSFAKTDEKTSNEEVKRSKYEIVWQLTFIQADEHKEYPHGWGFEPPLVKFPEDADMTWITKQCRELYSNDEFVCIGAIPKKINTWLSTLYYPREA